MEKLHNKILMHYKSKKQDKMQYIYSSYHVAGEGEHKILQHIKKNKIENTVIYGLDADLIFLAMASDVKNIYLMREETNININVKIHNNIKKDPIKDVEHDLIYVAISNVKQSLNKYMQDSIRIENMNFCDDFIILCFLLGNDFLPHFPSIDIYKEGLEYVLEMYKEIYLDLRQNLLIKNQDIKINNEFIKMLFKKLGNCEDKYFSDTYVYYKNK